MIASRPAIERRDKHFDLAGVDMARWHGGDPYITHLMNAMSLLFPEGERFFIRSVRECSASIEEAELKAQIRAFIGQEAMHGREHEAYNAALAAAGYPVDKLEAKLAKWLRFAEKLLPPHRRLAATMAAEHLTAIMAHALLSTPGATEPADPRMAVLWHWHAIEETEHKAVAFDVWARQRSGLRAYFGRCVALIEASLSYWIFTLGFYRAFLRHDGLAGRWRGWWSMIRFFFVAPGPMRKAIPLWFAWFKPGFHPWDHDNRYLLERWRHEQAGAAPPLAGPAPAQ